MTLVLCFFSAATWSACVPESDSNASVIHCKVKLDDYPRPVHFYYPVNHSAHYFVHFHGHNLEGYSHFDKRWGNYGQYLLSAKSDAVLVLPESTGNCTTYDAFFADPIRTKKFFDEVENEIGGAELIGLSGHSGAYRVLNRLAGYANKELLSPKAIGLFDATYGNTSEITRYVQTKSILFIDAFVTGPKATTEDLSRALMKQLKGDNVFFVPVKGGSSESLLDQHFMVLKRGGLETFFAKASSL